MPPNRASNSSNVRDARAALGQRLRELRRNAGLTGQQLAESLTWPPSKISKLENGRQTPTDADIQAWTQATHGGDETEALLASLHTLEAQYAEWQRVLGAGMRQHQHELAEVEQRVRFIRAFEDAVIPGLLQTAEYARECLIEGVRIHKVPDDLDEAVRGRIQRQEILYRPDKRFHFVLTEAALRVRRSSPEVMLGQLDRLISLAALPNVKFGIIGFGARYTIGPRHGFWLLDDEKVLVETYSAELDLRQPQEIELYAKVFEELATIASYGRAARSIITRTIDDLAPEAADEDSL